LRAKPFLYAGSAIKHFAADVRPGRSHAKRIPAVECAGVAPQFDGEFFFGKKFREDRFWDKHGDLLRERSRTGDDMPIQL
jgi:hypothetical protein